MCTGGLFSDSNGVELAILAVCTFAVTLFVLVLMSTSQTVHDTNKINFSLTRGLLVYILNLTIPCSHSLPTSESVVLNGANTDCGWGATARGDIRRIPFLAPPAVARLFLITWLLRFDESSASKTQHSSTRSERTNGIDILICWRLHKCSFEWNEMEQTGRPAYCRRNLSQSAHQKLLLSRYAINIFIIHYGKEWFARWMHEPFNGKRLRKHQ